ncbi:MAG: hypothetical protein U1F27_00510 [Turneriella sp.]
MLTINASLRYLRPAMPGRLSGQGGAQAPGRKNLFFVCDFSCPFMKRAAQGKYHYVIAEVR